MTHRTAACQALIAAVILAPAARADYALLRSGARLHVTGYERAGDRVRLTLQGGAVEIAAGELVAVEPEDAFPAPPPEKPAANLPYGKLIQAAAVKHGVDEKLIARVIAIESNFNAKAVSRKRARGLMQLMPKTAARYAVSNIFDPAENIEAGTHYLKDLLGRYSGNLILALAAYNAGPEMVDRYQGVPPIAETHNYVRRVTSALTPQANK